MNGLRSYAGRRLELGDMLRAALHLARSRGDAEAEEQARALLARLSADRFRLAVVGQFSRGKSTLMNALLGGAYLPMGALPMTSVITTVRYGSHPKAMVRRHQAALPVEVPLAGVAEFVAASSLRRAEMRVATVEVQVPAEILRLGFEFVDTPGVGSAIATSTATTRQFLPEADAVIFVTGFDSPLTEAEAGFLAEAYRHAGKLFLVLNKRDLVEDREAADVRDFVRRRLSEDLGVSQPRVFALSALEALEAMIHNDQGRLAASGLPGLRGPLEQFLTTDKTRLFLRNVADRAARLVSVQQRDLRLGRLALDSGPRIPEVLTAFDARVAELASLQRATASQLADVVDARLPDLLAGRSAAWQAGLRELLAPAIEEASAVGAAGETVGALLDSGRPLLEQAGLEATGPWLQRRAGEVHELLTGMAAAEIGTLLQAARSPGSIGAQIAGLAEDDGGRELAGWSARDLPGLTVRVPRWSVPVERPRRARRKPVPDDPELRSRLSDALDTAVTTFEERTRAEFLEAAREWVSRLADQTGRQLDEAAERFRRCLRTPPAEEDLAALEDLSSRLGDFRATLAGGVASADDDASQEPPGGTGRDTGRGDCVICTRMEKTLGQQLRHGQFLLATRESAQEQHSLAGGYCPPHTWQYAAVASPVGISAAYAKLTATVADALEAASERDRPPEDLGRAVADLTPPASECALCRALAACEREAIAGIVSSGPDGALCLRHLTLVLNAGPSAEAARTMLRALAATLRRDSEDMRGYALKREALRSGLVSDEESRAHLEALRRLAGLPALTVPWTDVNG
jgi:hypothetical protein